MHVTKRLAPVAIVAALAVSLGACGDDDDTEAGTDTVAAATDAPTTDAAAATTAPTDTTAHDDHQTVVIDGVDYGFENVPESVPAGTVLGFKNTSDEEFHEMVVIRIPDGEERSMEELAALPQEEADAIFGSAMPATVLVAGPGEEGMPVVGDGSITEPGRYAVICFIPVGADPEVVAEAMQSESSTPPDLGDGPPHIAAGMFAELTVTA